MRLIRGYLTKYDIPVELRPALIKSIILATHDCGPDAWFEGEKENFKGAYSHMVIDIDRLPVDLLSYLNIESKVDLSDDSTDPLTAMVRKSEAASTVVNNRVSVAVPGVGLLRITEVKAVYDYCTDALQVELANGWRILAICPQPDQRRPDYVLGRSPMGDD